MHRPISVPEPTQATTEIVYVTRTNACGITGQVREILPESATAIMEGHIESLRKGGAVDKILKPGAKAPTFTLKNQHDEDISCVDLIKRGPLVVNFTRGSWCPFCSAEVRALNEAYDQFRQAGIELVVLSPQSLDRTRKQATAGKLKFSLLADTNNEIAKAFGLVYTFPEDLKDVYRNVVKVDVQAVNETASLQLPIPARFVIDESGIIRDVKADPDYRFAPSLQKCSTSQEKSWSIQKRLPCKRRFEKIPRGVARDIKRRNWRRICLAV